MLGLWKVLLLGGMTLLKEVYHCMGVLWRSPKLRLLIFVNIFSNIAVYRYIDSDTDDVHSLPSCLQKSLLKDQDFELLGPPTPCLPICCHARCHDDNGLTLSNHKPVPVNALWS